MEIIATWAVKTDYFIKYARIPFLGKIISVIGLYYSKTTTREMQYISYDVDQPPTITACQNLLLTTLFTTLLFLQPTNTRSFPANPFHLHQVTISVPIQPH